MGKILLYYKYVDIQYPHQIMKWQKQLCADLDLKGRILIGYEGINGTVGGSEESIKKYKKHMNEHPLFSNIDFKESVGSADCFPKMYIVVRDEIVKLGIPAEELTPQDGGQHLSPDEVHTLLTDKPKDLVVLDARNECEWRVGAFEGAIKPEIKNFRELPEYIDKNLEQFKEKQVLMYCTGGIRCERATAYLSKKNIAKKIYQVEGGIHRYAEKYPNGHFRGKNYVFDGRVTVKINDDILGSCEICNTTCDDYINCLNALCNKHFICCNNCIKTLHGTCSQECNQLVSQKKVSERPPFVKAEKTPREH